MSGDENPREAALARAADRAVKTAEVALARADELDGRVGELKQMLGDLAQDVAQVIDDENQTVRSYILAKTPEQARAYLVDLVEWLERVYFHFPRTMLPSCWMWHPWVVDDLLTLRDLHADALCGKSQVEMGDWKDRWLPGVRDRIAAEIGTCELDEHRQGKPQSRPRPITPLVQHIDDVANAWTSTGRSPEPTEAQLADADDYEQTILNRPSS